MIGGAVTSLPYMSLAVVAAVSVLVYEMRLLLRNLPSKLRASEPQRTAERASLRDNRPDTRTAGPDEEPNKARSPAPATVVNASARDHLLEPEESVDWPPPHFR